MKFFEKNLFFILTLIISENILKNFITLQYSVLLDNIKN